MSALGVPAERRGRLHHWLLGKAADSMKRTNIYVGAHASDGIDERVGGCGRCRYRWSGKQTVSQPATAI